MPLAGGRRRLYPLPVSQPGESTAVVFAATEDALRVGLDVRLGPFVPAAGRRRALCSPLMQHGSEQPHHTAALYTVLTGNHADEALTLVEQEGDGRLFVWSDDFVAALASKNAELQALADADDAQNDEELTTFTAALDALDAQWLAAAHWPAHFVGTRNRLAPRLGRAAEAQQRHLPVWCWYGPAVPTFQVVNGEGPYPANRE